jgi:hypothetical protein
MILLKAVTNHPPVEPKPKARLAVGCLAPPADAPDLSIERDVIGIACDATRIDFSCRLMLRRHPLGMMLRGLACESWRATIMIAISVRTFGPHFIRRFSARAIRRDKINS